MSRFTNACDRMFAESAGDQTQFGENGTLEYTARGVRDARVGLFFALVRNLASRRLQKLMDECFVQAERQTDPAISASIVADLFVMTFQTRHCRGGKGEKTLFDNMLLALYRRYPQTVISLIGLIPAFGCYKDYFRLLTLIGDKPEYETLRNKVIARVAFQLRKDEKSLNRFNEEALAQFTASAEESSSAVVADKRPKISLCAKYAPREGSALVNDATGKAWFKQLRNAIFADASAPDVAVTQDSSKQAYRRLISQLTGALDICEVKMCRKTFRDIDFSHVPSLCLNKNRKAFLNEVVPRKPKGDAEQIMALGSYLRSRGSPEPPKLRHPSDPDRMECRQHLFDACCANTLNGKQLHPHVLVSQMMPHSQTLAGSSSVEHEIWHAQWTKIRENLVESMEKLNAGAIASSAEESPKRACARESDSPTNHCKPVDFTKLVPLVDVSGSMAGDPMHAAIALGLLTSEVNHSAFRNRFITFSETPTWVTLNPEHKIAQKVAITASAPWGGSTNIEAAFDLILQVVVSERLTADEVPDLIIFSDMQFDQAAGGGSKTQLNRIRDRFAAAGVTISGQPYPAPRIVFWNLRAVSYGGFPAQDNDENVQMLSGFSPSLLEAVLSGVAVTPVNEKVVVDGVETTVTRKPTPYDTLRGFLDNAKYFPVRLALSKSQEGLLAEYSFDQPETVASSKKRSGTTAVNVEKRSRTAAVVAAGAGAITPVTQTVGEMTALELDEDWDLVEDV